MIGEESIQDLRTSRIVAYAERYHTTYEKAEEILKMKEREEFWLDENVLDQERFV